MKLFDIASVIYRKVLAEIKNTNKKIRFYTLK